MTHHFFNTSSKGKSGFLGMFYSETFWYQTPSLVWNLLPKGPYKKCSEKQVRNSTKWIGHQVLPAQFSWPPPSCFATSTGAPAPASTGTRVRRVQLEFSCLCWEAARLMSAKCLPPVISQWSCDHMWPQFFRRKKLLFCQECQKRLPK